MSGSIADALDSSVLGNNIKSMLDYFVSWNNAFVPAVDETPASFRVLATIPGTLTVHLDGDVGVVNGGKTFEVDVANTVDVKGTVDIGNTPTVAQTTAYYVWADAALATLALDIGAVTTGVVASITLLGTDLDTWLTALGATIVGSITLLGTTLTTALTTLSTNITTALTNLGDTITGGQSLQTLGYNLSTAIGTVKTAITDYATYHKSARVVGPTVVSKPDGTVTAVITADQLTNLDNGSAVASMVMQVGPIAEAWGWGGSGTHQLHSTQFAYAGGANAIITHPQ